MNEFSGNGWPGPADGGVPGREGCGCGGRAGQARPQEPAQAPAEMLPQVTFSTFILSLGSSALVHLGEVPEPESGQMRANLPLAKHTIDILAMLRDKTVRCLDQEEAKLLEGLLYEMRMKYLVKAG